MSLFKIQKYCHKQNFAGSKHIRCVPVQWIVDFPEIVSNGHNYLDSINLIPGKDWLIVPCVHGTISFTEPERQTPHGSVTHPTVRGFLANDTPNQTMLLNSMKANEWVVLLIYKTGESKLIGSLDFPARFKSDFKNDTNISGEKGYQLEFRSSGSSKSFFLDEDLPDVPACSPGEVRVKKSDNELIAVISSPSGSATPYNVADSLITVNSATFASVKATDSLNVPIVDSNGDAVATTVVGGEVQVDALPCEAPADEWIRPADWLDMPALTSTDDEIALLHAVWDNDSNFAALRCATTTGDYQVDWGDGTVTTHASNVVAEHQYDYATYDTGGATLSSRGYKQAMIKITPITGGLATFDTNFRHSTQNQVYATGYLDVLLSMPNASAGQSIFFRSQLVSNRYMEQVEILNSGVLSNAQQMFDGCTSLQSVPLFDTSSVTTMNRMFEGCASLQSVPLFDTSSVTTMNSMFRACASLQSVPLFDTSSVTNMVVMFQDCNSLQSVPLFDTSSVTTMFRMFFGCTSLQSVPLFDTVNVTNMQQMFDACASLQSVPLFDTSSVTNMLNMFFSCASLQSVPLFDTVNVTNMQQMFRDCTSLQSAPAFNTVNVTNMVGMFRDCTSHSKTDIICRTSVRFDNNQLSRDGIVNIFNNLIDLTGLTSQNINITGNYGVANLTTADIEIATDKNWTVTT